LAALSACYCTEAQAPCYGTTAAGMSRQAPAKPAMLSQQNASAPQEAPPAPSAEKEQTDIASRCQLALSENIRTQCKIPDEDAYFAFDSTKLTSRDERVLTELAECFTTGPMTGQPMRLIGHTDPRGSDQYNMWLGQRRAESVKAALVAEGMSPESIAAFSRGKLDASGHDEASWALDRRVDVQ
jgi:outer membrane protein OmpA-like peptidoglycan-associated protein